VVSDEASTLFVAGAEAVWIPIAATRMISICALPTP
jgi:hypothetical protein